MAGRNDRKMNCASPMRPVVCGHWQTNTMRTHLLHGTRDTIIGTIGAVASWNLQEWNAAVGIAAGVVTIVYIVSRTVFLFVDRRSGVKG